MRSRRQFLKKVCWTKVVKNKERIRTKESQKKSIRDQVAPTVISPLKILMWAVRRRMRLQKITWLSSIRISRKSSANKRRIRTSRRIKCPCRMQIWGNLCQRGRSRNSCRVYRGPPSRKASSLNIRLDSGSGADGGYWMRIRRRGSVSTFERRVEAGLNFFDRKRHFFEKII